jgi:hypothetical protein
MKTASPKHDEICPDIRRLVVDLLRRHGRCLALHDSAH